MDIVICRFGGNSVQGSGVYLYQAISFPVKPLSALRWVLLVQQKC